MNKRKDKRIMARKKPLKVEILLDKDNMLRIEGWLRDGLSIQQICTNLGVNALQWYKAIEMSDEFAKLSTRTKDVVDREVENALYKRAMGYEYEEITEEYEMGFLVKKKVVTKHMPPDTGAQVFWLKNRKSDVWRDRREVDNTLALEKLDEVLGQIKGCE
jgi:hypothetical protein